MDVIRQTGITHGLPRRCLADSCAQHLADNHFINRGAVEARSFHQHFHHGSPQVRSLHIR